MFSKAHYERVSPRPDTPAQIEERKLNAKACEAARGDMSEKYPVLTPDNAREAITYQEQRISFHRNRLGIHTPRR